MTTVLTKTMLESWLNKDLQDYLKARSLPTTGRKTELVSRILQDQERSNMVDATINNNDQAEQKRDDSTDQITLTRAEYEALLQNGRGMARTRSEEDIETTQRVNDYLRVQADNTQDSLDRHPTSIVRDLKKG